MVAEGQLEGRPVVEQLGERAAVPQPGGVKAG